MTEIIAKKDEKNRSEKKFVVKKLIWLLKVFHTVISHGQSRVRG